MSRIDIRELLALDIYQKLLHWDWEAFKINLIIGYPCLFHSSRILTIDFTVEELPIAIEGKILILTLII